MRKIYFDMSIEIHIFVMHSIFQERGNLPIVDRHFLCLVLSIRRFRTPVWSVNAPTAWLVKSNGKGGTALIS